jgi:hypothetical protein
MFGARTWTQIGLLGVGIAASLLYGLSGWVTKRGLSVVERIGRGIALLLSVSCVIALYGWQFRPGWHLTSEQEDGLADVAKNIPKNIVVLVELPENSIAGQDYGKTSWEF